MAELRRAGSAALAGLVGLALLAGCGSAEPSAEARSGDPEAVVDISGTDPVGEMTAGSVASLVECRDWKEASTEEQLATIEDVRSQLNPADAGIDAPELTDEEAREVFDSSCKPSWASGLRLYKLYAHAAGFIELKRALDDSQALQP